MGIAGTVEIVGRLNIDDIQRGQRAVVSGFEIMNQKSQSNLGSMNRLGQSAKGFGSTMVQIAGLGVAGLTTLAGLTPILADEFAKAKVETFKLAQVFGKELEPAVQAGLRTFSDFVSFMEGGSPLAEFTKDVSVLTGAAGIGLIGTKLLGLKTLGKIVIPVTIAAGIVSQSEAIREGAGGAGESIAGFLGGSEGGFAEGALGTGGRIAGDIATFGSAGAILGAAIGSLFGGVGAVPGAAIGGTAGAIGGLVGGTVREVRDQFFYDTDTVGLG